MTSRPARWPRLLRSIGLALAIPCLGLLAAATLFLDAFIFFPSGSGEWGAATGSRFPVEEVPLSTPDGEALVCWHLRVPSPRATLLFFHGNAGNLTHRLDALETLGGIGVDAFLLGYRGYGRSTGRPSERGLYVDAETAHRHLTGKVGVPADRLVLLGESLGCAVAIDLATKRPCAGLVLQSPFASVREMATQVLPFPPIRWIVPRKFDNLGKIGSIAAPKLFLASRRDEIVPWRQTRALFEAAKGEKTWVEFDDAGHNELFLLHRREWAEAIARFVGRACPDR